MSGTWQIKIIFTEFFFHKKQTQVKSTVMDRNLVVVPRNHTGSRWLMGVYRLSNPAPTEMCLDPPALVS